MEMLVLCKSNFLDKNSKFLSKNTIEKGPWHPSRQHTEYWAEQLRQAGYVVEIESQAGAVKEDNSDLAAALASMA